MLVAENLCAALPTGIPQSLQAIDFFDRAGSDTGGVARQVEREFIGAMQALKDSEELVRIFDVESDPDAGPAAGFPVKNPSTGRRHLPPPLA